MMRGFARRQCPQIMPVGRGVGGWVDRVSWEGEGWVDRVCCEGGECLGSVLLGCVDRVC